MSVMTPENELLSLSDNSTASLERAIEALAIAIARGNGDERRRKLSTLADVIRFSQQLADLIGRRRVLLEAREAEGKSAPRLFAATPVIPNVPFSEAISDLIRRTPFLAGTAKEVAKVYSREHGFAVAKSAELSITERIQATIRRALKEGKPAPDTTEIIAKLGNFKRAYAETVYRTNLSTAYTAGRFRAASDPVVKLALPAFQYSAVKDSTVRRGRSEDSGENHLALDKMIAPTDWEGWNVYAPPNGYNCRCTLRLVSMFELRRAGLLPLRDPNVSSSASVNPLFAQGRPDFQLYLGVNR